MQPTTEMSLPVIIVVLLGGSLGASCNMLYFVMIGKINERVPEKERISYLGWGTGVRTKYKQLYPGSKIVLLADLCIVLMAACFLFIIKFWVFA